MSNEVYKKLSEVLDEIETQLDVIAKTVGHPSYSLWRECNM